MQKSRAEYQRKWRSENPDKVKRHNQTASERKKKWWSDNRERILPDKRAKWKSKYHANKEKEMKSCRKWQKENPDRVRATKYKWLRNNHEKAKKVQRDFRIRNWSNPSFRLRRNLSIRLSKAIAKNGKKCAKTAEILGCSLDSFRMYLESLFESGMSWENYGSVWHIDHIVPCAIFDLSKPEHQKRCFHFSNLQPLFAKENILKGDKETGSHQFGLL